MVLAVLVGFGAAARHIKGGWIYYEYLGQGTSNPNNLRYKVVIKVYRDCSPPSNNQNDAAINVTVFATSSGQSISSFSAPMSQQYTLNKSSFNQCINPVPTVCYVVLEYTGYVELPPMTGGYTLSFQRCCRINGIVNIAGASNQMGNTYTIQIPGNQSLSNAPANNSPIFAEKDTAVVCYNSTIEFDYSATDVDGDSLVYAFSNALEGSGAGNPNPGQASSPPYSSLPYQSPFTAKDPFATGLVINPRTGLITGRSPNQTGEYVLAVSVREYRNGIFIAETRKELHVNVANCSLAAAVLPPSIMSCDDFTVQFENGSTSPAILSYNWDFGVATRSDDVSTAPNPTYTYPDTGIYIAKLVINRGQACSDSATTQVKVFPGFNAGFMVDGACVLLPYQFTDTTKARYGTVTGWSWDFGDPGSGANTSALQNPQHSYPAANNYNVTFIVSSSKGCIDTVNKTLQVLEKPIVKLAFRDTLICSIDSLQLVATGSGNFTWTPLTRIINPNTPTPTVYPVDTITYYVTLNDRGLYWPRFSKSECGGFGYSGCRP